MAGKLSTAVVVTALVMAGLSTLLFALVTFGDHPVENYRNTTRMFAIILLMLVVAALHERIHQEERR